MNTEELHPFVRFAGPTTFREPRLPSRTRDCRLLYTLSGKGTAVIGGKTVALSRGVLFLFLSGTEYSFSPDGAVSFLTVDFDLTREYAGETDFYLPCPSSAFDPATAHRTPLPEGTEALARLPVLADAFGVEPLLSELCDEFRLRRPYYAEVCSSILRRVLFLVLRAEAFPDRDPELTARISDFISLHYAEPISNADIAAALNYNPSYLNRRMREATGRSLHRYLLDYRLSVAVGLLLNTELPVSEIALRTGFSGLPHFSAFFRASTGTHPMQYRRKQTP